MTEPTNEPTNEPSREQLEAVAAHPDASGPPAPPEPPPPPGLLGLCRELLQRPDRAFARIHARPVEGLQCLALAIALLAAYGVAAATYQGGFTFVLAAWKAPAVILGSILVCLPSLWVFSTLAGAEGDLRWLHAFVTGLATLLALVMIGLAPVVWLFSVSSRSLLSVVVVHLLVGMVSILLAGSFLGASLAHAGSRGALVPWVFLLLLVAMQVTTNLRPILWYREGQPAAAGEKRFFLEHLRESSKLVQGVDTAAAR